MTMKGRALLVGVLAATILANILVGLDALTGAGVLLPASPAAAVRAPHSPAPRSAGLNGAQAREAEAAYRALVAELTAQKERLDRRARELTERERQIVVLRQELETQGPVTAPASVAPATSPSADGPDPFKRLVRTYGAMAPENAARALWELHSRAPETAIDLFLALPTQKAGDILDALATTRPALAAQLSLEISHRSAPISQ